MRTIARKTDWPITCHNSTNQKLVPDVFGSSHREQTIVTEFDRVCKRRKLKVNVDKSKVLRCSKEDPVPGLQIQLGGEQLEKVDSFKYLGAKVTEKGTLGQEVQSRVIEAGRAMGGMKKIVKNREMGMGAK